jgi:hypothetical protein
MSKSVTVSICTLITGPLLGLSLGGSSALAAACTIAPVSTYTATGFSCSVGPVTFSNIAVTDRSTGTGSTALGDFTPFSLDNEHGLNLTYSATTGLGAGTTDVAWTYKVSAAPDLVDAFASLTGTTTGAGSIGLGETLSNGKTLTLAGSGATMATFTPIAMLAVSKDQSNFAATGSSASTSIMTNAFSVVPEPSTWAMMLLGFAGLGFVAYRRAPKLQAIE